MYKWLGKYFGFSHRELRGIITLCVVLLLIWTAPRIYRYGWPVASLDTTEEVQEIEEFLIASFVEEERGSVDEVSYFTFDPNGLSVEEWKRLGLAEYQIRMIKNYEAAGGQFRNSQDLKKIYAITDTDYDRLEPYIRISQLRTNAEKKAKTTEESHAINHTAYPEINGGQSTTHKALLIELNTADSIDLQELPGIGPVFASRIVRFRDLLGGFHEISQLLQVYGLDTSRFDGLKAYIHVDTAAVVKIPVNLADYDRLRQHPFISNKLANLIIQYRRQHGPYRQMEDLFNIAVMDAEIFRKIVPYLKIVDD